MNTFLKLLRQVNDDKGKADDDDEDEDEDETDDNDDDYEGHKDDD